MADDLQVLFPDKEIVVGGETLTIKPFTARQWPKVISVFQKLQPLLQPKDGGEAKGDGETVDMLGIFAAGADDLYLALGIAAHKPLEWFDEVPMDDAIKLFSLVLEINQTFFVERIAPMLPDLLARFGLQAAKAEDGAEPLPSSSLTDTGGVTSKTTPSTKSSSSKEKAAA
ncbi:MAG: DUF6631 family protein [Burkholderiales bacterium]